MFRKQYLMCFMLLLTIQLYAQNYEKEKGTLRLLTYNTHYCKGATDPGELTKGNISNLAQVIKALDADVVALQELDSAAQSRGARYLLKEIADATGIEYVAIYGNAAPFNKGSIGCGVLVKKSLPIKQTQLIHLPGDESRVAVKVELNDFIFIGTHSDLNDTLRKEGAEMVCAQLNKESKPIFLAGDLNDSHRWAQGGISFPVWLEHFQIISDVMGNSIPGRTDSGALIDYILLYNNPKASIVEVKQSYILRSITIDHKPIDTATVSDHYPLFVDIKI